MIVFQLMLYCLLFTVMVKIGVGNNALNVLYFYPKAYQEKVYEMGLADSETVQKKTENIHDCILYCYDSCTSFHYRAME